MTDVLKNYISNPRVLVEEEQIKKRIAEMGAQISREYEGKILTAICILKGGIVFFSDIIRNIKLPMRCEFIGTSSYGNEKRSSGEVMLTLDTKFPIEGEDVIVFEDIVDSGVTLSYIMKLLKARNPASIKLCTLLFKPECMKTDVKIDYLGFEIGNHFVVGCGLDYAGFYRNLPYVGMLE